jgi:hypothetical protein
MRQIRVYSVYQIFYFMAIMSLLFFKSLGFVEFLRVYVIIEVVCYTVLTAMTIFIITRYELSLKIAV